MAAACPTKGFPLQLITQRHDTLRVLGRCRSAGCALFSPNGELAGEIEGLLIGGQRFAEEHGIEQLPIAVGMTGIYADNPQFRKISTGCVTDPILKTPPFTGGSVRQGCEIWLRTLAVYENLAGSFENVRILPFIDHGWAVSEEDRQMLFDDSVVARMAIIMHDASALDYQQNIDLTAQYVERYGKHVVIEAAADKIYDPNDIKRLKLTRQDQLSKPEDVVRFVKETGVDLIVPNLGTEHRSVGAGAAERKYERELAHAIRDKAGAIMALHGSSSLGGRVGTTASDGICKVNFYTAMAVGAGQHIYKALRELEPDVLEGNSLWANSESFSHDLRRRHVARVCYDMLQTLGYQRLREVTP